MLLYAFSFTVNQIKNSFKYFCNDDEINFIYSYNNILCLITCDDTYLKLKFIG